MTSKHNQRKQLESAIEAFLEKGGKIQVYDEQDAPEQTHYIKPNTQGAPHLMSLDEGALYFGSKNKRKRTKYQALIQNNKHIPKELRDKLLRSTKDEG